MSNSIHVLVDTYTNQIPANLQVIAESQTTILAKTYSGFVQYRRFRNILEIELFTFSEIISLNFIQYSLSQQKQLPAGRF